jgi:N utilization substance protein B
MGSRRKAREHALKLLYQFDIAPAEADRALELYWSGERVRPEVRDFADRIVRGVLENLGQIDGLISGHTHHWKIRRIAAVDRNLLRLAIWEFLHEPETPRAVIINEALEIAKRYSTEDSSQFINGILDGIRKLLEGEDSHRAEGDSHATCPGDDPAPGDEPG